MKIRSLLVFTAMAAGAIVSLPAQAANDTGGSEIIVAIIDTGIRSTHQEFDYQGKASTTDQIVAWWDFSSDTTPALSPAPGQTWDPRVDNPFDGHGHGTATASAAVGLNKVGAAFKEPSFAPGFKLAVAKVGKGNGRIDGDLALAVKWSVDTVKADVISISIGPIIPSPAILSNIDEAIAYARSKGVAVAVSNGNGVANAGVPGDPGWASPYSNINALSVGGSGGTLTPYQITTDPEVAAKFTQRLASKACNTCYTSISGTSFSAPLVAGMAAKLMSIAVANGQNSSPAYIETLLKYIARDTNTPPTFEGYGILDGVAFAAGPAHAAAGTLPARPNPDPNLIYVETVANGLRDIWSEKADGTPLEQLHNTGVDPGTAQGVIGPSAPTGLDEGEVYSITTTPGQSVTITLAYSPSGPDQDIDLFVFKGAGPSFDQGAVTRSTKSSGVPEAITFVAEGGTYSIVALGWLIALNQPYTLTTNAADTFSGDDYYIATFGSGLF